jgi:ketosteroid isomerase-like protein
MIGGAAEPAELAVLFVERADAGDVEGLVALYTADAVLALPDGDVARGSTAIRQFYAELLATRPSFTAGEQHPVLRTGDLALTSTRLPGGDATAEVAVRGPDGRWRWRLDRPSVAGAR